MYNTTCIGTSLRKAFGASNELQRRVCLHSTQASTDSPGLDISHRHSGLTLAVNAFECDFIVLVAASVSSLKNYMPTYPNDAIGRDVLLDLE